MTTAAQRRDQRAYVARRAKRQREELRRLRQCNDLLRTIASCGRKFFRHGRYVARFELSERGHVMFVDHYSHKRVFARRLGIAWSGFTHGGTLREVVSRLAAYIKDGEKLPARLFGPWPKDCCGGDLWAYGDDMAAVRQAAAPMLEAEREWPPPPLKRGKKT